MKRSVETSFWSDPYVENLSTSEKLLFLYLLTNDNTNMLGIYETSIKRIAFETGIDKATILKALKGFAKDSKVFFKMDRFIVLPNFLKHQNMNPNMKKSAVDIYNNLPNELKVKGLTQILERNEKGFERLGKALLMLPKNELELEEEIEEEEEEEKKKEKLFAEQVRSLTTNLPNSEVQKFIDYWTEKSPRGKKMKFEKQKTFDPAKRLKTWELNYFEWSNQKSKEPQPTKNPYYGKH